MVDFNQIPDTRVPGVYVEFDATRAISGPSLQPYVVLIVAQKLDAANGLTLTPSTFASVNDAIAAGGAGSQLHKMAEAFFDNNSSTRAVFVAVDDPAGANATGTFAFSGTANVAGTLAAYIAGRRLQVGIAAGATATEVGAALAAAINADQGQEVTGGASTGTVTATAKHAGVCGNGIDLRVNYRAGENLPDGLTVAVTPMSGGTGTIDLADVWAVVGEQQFNVLALATTDEGNLDSMSEELQSRWEALRHIEGVAILATNLDFGDLITLGNARNSPFVAILPSFGSPSTSWAWAAAAAGQVAAAAQLDPARPFRTLPLAGILAPALQDRLVAQERDTLLHNGISTAVVNPGGGVELERVISTYQKSSLGTADDSFLDIGTVLTDGYLRFDIRAMFSSKYPRHKLGDDDVRFAAGQAVITPSIAKGELIARYAQWMALGLVEDPDTFRTTLVVEKNARDKSRLDIQCRPNLVNGLNVIAVQVQFTL